MVPEMLQFAFRVWACIPVPLLAAQSKQEGAGGKEDRTVESREKKKKDKEGVSEK